MLSPNSFIKRIFSVALLCSAAIISTADAQQQTEKRTPEQSDDVVRINTDLV